jgi:bifunctional DNA-binding transcriptional regulator/antitoxin component of YhaV-PrlF toxin-antitoxin module
MTEMGVISVRLEKSGRVLIPVAVRRQLGLKEGESDLLLYVDENPVRVGTRAQALARLQAAAARVAKPGESWSREMIEDRRREAERETAE